MSGFALKMIALCSMLFDHALKVLPVFSFLTGTCGFPAEAVTILLEALAPFGRLAMPIFSFCAAESCRYTKSPPRYLGRLLAFAFLSELPFRLAFSNVLTKPVYSFWPPGFYNTLATLFLGACACFSHRALVKRGQLLPSFLIPLVFVFLAELFRTDYGGWGVLLILAAYIPPKGQALFTAMAGVLTLLYLSPVFWGGRSFLRAFFSLLGALSALLLIHCYNGKPGRRFKWGFYLFYPIHLLALFLLRHFPV